MFAAREGIAMYDYVIVGAGSAGCVLANRLSEDPDVTVLLIEAGGPDSNELIHIPAAWTALFRTDQDWDHSTGYEPHCDNRRIFLPRGKVLGGSSSVNGMIYIRGNRRDYDEWRDLGCVGWGWRDLLPYFKRAEDNERGASDLHGVGGPLRVSDPRVHNAIQQAFIDAAIAHGIPRNDDFNGPEQDGVGWYQFTQRDGRRESTAACYLHPAMDRPNLTVETRAHVLQVQFEGPRAVGVRGARLDRTFEFRAEREVIICAGAYGSPQLLMLSGIGRPDELVQLQIEPVAEVPGVGLNLQDHHVSGVVYLTHREDTLFGTYNEVNLAQYAQGQGPLTGAGNEAGGFVRSRDHLDAPDLQLFGIPALWVDEGLAPAHAPGVTVGASPVKPSSRGRVMLVSADPTAKPLIVHNYLCEPEDLRVQTAGIRLVMEIAGTQPLAACLGKPYLAPASDSDDDLAAYVRARVQTQYHPVGTCKMGIDDLAVVDADLRVRGVDGLRVVDASVMPTVPRGNTNAPTIAVAERAADLIRGRAAPHGEADVTRHASAG
ncbi:MAG: GMC family oxidoreductase [Solirubrobacteraceae bacterium]